MKKKPFSAVKIVVWLFIVFTLTAPLSAVTLANRHKRGLQVNSIDQVLQLPDDEIDIGTAALIVSEQWSEVVHGLRYREQLDAMAEEILNRLRERHLRPNFRAIPIINHYLFDELGYDTVANADNPNDLFLHSVMDNRKGYCLSLSILYLSLAERIGMPLYGVVVPGHFFVRYDSRTQRFNIETTAKGASLDDEHYIQKYAGSLNQNNSLYMANLSKRQTLGCLFNNFGVVYMETGKLEEALLALDLAVRINPTLSEARANMGNIYLRQGSLNEAIDQFNKALKINPGDPKTHYNLGTAYLNAERYREAEDHLEQTLVLDPNFVDAIVQLAKVYTAQKRYYNARTSLEDALLTHPGNASLSVQLALVYMEMGLDTKAMQLFQDVLTADPRNPEALFELALCYSKLNKTDEAIATYQRLLRYEPDMFPARVNLGHAYFNKRNFPAAIEQYKRAVALDDTDPLIYLNLGIACSENNDPDSGLIYLNQAITLDPKLGNAHYGLAVIYFNQQKYALAWDHITKAKEFGIDVPREQMDAIAAKAKQAGTQ